MSSTDALLSRQLNARGVALNIGTDLPVAIRIRYTGKGTATSVAVTTATNVVLVSAETSGTVTLTVAFSSFTTIGSVVDQINAGGNGNWEARALDSLRSDASASTMVQQTITSGSDENGVTIWDATADTSALKAFTGALSLHRNWNYPGLGHRVKLQEFVYNITLGGVAAGDVLVYQRTKQNIETLLFSDTSVSATKEDYQFASGFGTITALQDSDLIVRVKDGTSITDSSANYLRVYGILE